MYGMFCSGGFKIGTQSIVVNGYQAFNKACHALGEALGVKTASWSLASGEESYEAPESFDDSPKLVLAQRRDLKSLDALSLRMPHGSRLVIRHDGSSFPLDFSSWIARGNHVVSHHEAHPELIPELVSLSAKKFLDLDALVALVGVHEECDSSSPHAAEQLRVQIV